MADRSRAPSTLPQLATQLLSNSVKLRCDDADAVLLYNWSLTSAVGFLQCTHAGNLDIGGEYITRRAAAIPATGGGGVAPAAALWCWCHPQGQGVSRIEGCCCKWRTAGSSRQSGSTEMPTPCQKAMKSHDGIGRFSCVLDITGSLPHDGGLCSHRHSCAISISS